MFICFKEIFTQSFNFVNVLRFYDDLSQRLPRGFVTMPAWKLFLIRRSSFPYLFNCFDVLFLMNFLHYAAILRYCCTIVLYDFYFCSSWVSFQIVQGEVLFYLP